MKHQYFLIVASLFAMVLSSCISDDSSESDGSINISISGLEESYNVVSFTDDKLVITPTVTSSLPADDLTYEWSYFEQKDNSYGSAKVEKHPLHFSDGKDLDSKLELAEGQYVFIITVTSKSTGYKQMASTRVYTSCDISKGFVILKEDADGNSDYDLYNTSNKGFVEDVLKSLGDGAVPGKPRHGDVNYEFAFQDPETDKCNNANCYCLTTENNEVRWIRLSDAATVMTADNAHFEFMPGEIPYRTVRGYFTTYYLTSNGVWSCYTGSSAGVGILGSFSGDGGSTHCVGSPSAFYSLVYWDEQTRSIAFSDYNNGYVPPMSLVPGYEVQNTNYDCITCGANTTAGEIIYFLLQDRTTHKKVMYYFDCSAWSPMLVNVEELDDASNFANASSYAVCCSQATVAYGVRNNKVFTYDLSGSQTEREITVPGLPSGETITYISNRYFSMQDAFDYLIIGTQSGDTYHAYFYNMVGGEPVGQPALTLTGTGKIHSVDFADPAVGSMAPMVTPILDK